jgi:hypothetical protein
MNLAATWLRLETRRRWGSLLVLALLVALTAGTVLTAVAGARRGQTAYSRLWARTLPATVAVLANQPGFAWSKVEALPEVAATGLFVVYSGAAVYPRTGTRSGGTDLEFPPGNGALMSTVERPVVLQGRRANPARVDEVMATPDYMSAHGLQVGDQLTVRLSSPAQATAGFDASTGTPLGPRLTVHLMAVIRSPFFMDQPGGSGTVVATYAFFQRYRRYIIGSDPAETASLVNALIRLKGGEKQIPAFRADLARVTGRSDIDVLDDADWLGEPVRTATGYEAACLLAFGLAALLAALFLVGQAIARYASGSAADLQVLKAVGLTRGQAAVSAAIAPGLAAAAGATIGVAAAIVASQWTPIGMASLAEPHPGLNADWLVLGTGWVIAVVLVTAAIALLTWSGLTIGKRRAAPRGSAIAAAAAGAGLPVATVVGARFALEPGRGRAAVPVLPAIAGAVAGVLGVLAVFTFSAGVQDAIAHPARFGITWQLTTFYGFDGQDFGPAAQVERATAASPIVAGYLDLRVGGAQAKGVSIESFTYAPVDGKRVHVVLTAGAMPHSPDQITLAPTTARELHAGVGSTLRLTGGPQTRTMTVSGIGFVPTGPHNNYDQGAWLTTAGFDRLFHGAHYAFKFHFAVVALKPGVATGAAARRLTATAAAINGGKAFAFTAAPGGPVQQLKDLAVLPTALGSFLALLAAGAVGYGLTTTSRRRGHELAVLRALGITSWQARLVVVTQATVLAVAGVAAGIPLGLATARTVWRAVANFTPLAYQPPFSPWALALIAPAALLTANLLALWPGRRAARLRAARVLRAE